MAASSAGGKSLQSKAVRRSSTMSRFFAYSWNAPVFLYFAGHGERNGDQFYLCTSETDPTRLGETALSSLELNRILGDFRGRGLFVVLDCCRGAGFAEHAPTVFWSLGSSEFKDPPQRNQRGSIVLGVARWLWNTIHSHPIITRILKGEEVPGSKPGLIYLSELFEYIRNRMTEEFELSSRLP